MSFLRCWQLRKQRKTSYNGTESLHDANHLSQPSSDLTPPYGQQISSVDEKRRPKSKNTNKTEGKRHVVGDVSLIDPFKKLKKKGDKSIRTTDLRANGVGHQKDAKALTFSSKKVPLDAPIASCVDSGEQQPKDSKGSYDYIDADECQDGGHSLPFYPISDSQITAIHSSSSHCPPAVASSPQSRYDYLEFGGKKDHQQQLRQHQQQLRQQHRVAVPPRRVAVAAEEPLYATASSHIYSMGGSEDPYSSIVSIGGGYGGGSSSAAYDQHGYSRIINTRNGTGPGTSKMTGIAPPPTALMAQAALCKNNSNLSELDELYAKIDRKTSSLVGRQPTMSSSSQYRQQQPYQQQQAELGGGESGSGSVCSSTQPSYRYLTVREDAAVIRERIRQREEEQQANLERRLGQERDDAYYSTIGNEYETVGDGNAIMTNGGSVDHDQRDSADGPNLLSSFNSFRQPVPPLPLQNRLSLNVDFDDHASSASSPTPLPPTSPIPKLQSQLLQQCNHHQQHHQQSSSAAFSSPTTKVPPPPPPPLLPPPFMRCPVIMPSKNSSPNNGPVTNGCDERKSAPLLPNAASPKKSATSALRLSFFNGSPLSFFNSSSKVTEKCEPPPLTLPPPNAMLAETNGDHLILANGGATNGKADDHCCTNTTAAAPPRHSRIPIFKRPKHIAATAGGIHRARTPSPAAAAASGASSTAAASCCAADVGTQTAVPLHNSHQQRHFVTNKNAAPMNNPPPPSSSRRSSPLPAQLGQDYVSTIELSKKGGGTGGDQRGWPLRPAATMTTSVSSGMGNK